MCKMISSSYVILVAGSLSDLSPYKFSQNATSRQQKGKQVCKSVNNMYLQVLCSAVGKLHVALKMSQIETKVLTLR